MRWLCPPRTNRQVHGGIHDGRGYRPTCSSPQRNQACAARSSTRLQFPRSQQERRISLEKARNARSTQSAGTSRRRERRSRLGHSAATLPDERRRVRSGSTRGLFPFQRRIGTEKTHSEVLRIQSLRSDEFPRRGFPETWNLTSRLQTAARDTGWEPGAATACPESSGECSPDAAPVLVRSKNKGRHPNNAGRMSRASSSRRSR